MAVPTCSKCFSLSCVHDHPGPFGEQEFNTKRKCDSELLDKNGGQKSSVFHLYVLTG